MKHDKQAYTNLFVAPQLGVKMFFSCLMRLWWACMSLPGAVGTGDRWCPGWMWSFKTHLVFCCRQSVCSVTSCSWIKPVTFYLFVWLTLTLNGNHHIWHDKVFLRQITINATGTDICVLCPQHLPLHEDLVLLSLLTWVYSWLCMRQQVLVAAAASSRCQHVALAVPQLPPTATARNATQTRVALENLKYSKCFSHFEVHNWLTQRENNTWACQNSVISPSTAALSEINLRAAKCFLPLSPARNVHAYERGISYQPTTIISRPNKVFSK